MKTFRALLLVLCAAAGGFAASASAATITSTGTTDLVIGFRATGGTGATLNLEADLGTAASYVNDVTGTKRQIATFSGADIVATYGANWKTRTDVLWGFAAASGGANRTLYGSRAQLTPGVQSDPYDALIQSLRNTSGANIISMVTGLNGLTSTANSTVTAQVGTDSGSSWTAQGSPDSGEYFGYASFETSSFENGTVFGTGNYVVSDLWRITGGSTTVTYIGSFALDANGALWFSKNPADFGTLTAPSITTAPVAQTVSAGQDATFTVAATGTAPLSYRWQLNNVDVPGATDSTLTISGALAANAGSYTVIVTNSVSSATSTPVTLTVNRATPSFTWAAPTAITYGTALSAVQLGATTAAAGTFSYTPAVGTVLGAGASQTLSVSFTPTDTASYNSATASVLLTVNPALLTVTADNLSRAYGAANPTLTFTYAGFVNNDTATNLTAAPTPATVAGLASPVGPYAITLTGGTAANYALTLVAGTLTVTKASATVTLGNLAATYDGTAKSASVTTIPAGLTVVVTYDSTATAPTAAGNHAVVATVNETNYQGAASGTLVIGRAAPVLTWTAPTAITYGTALTATQLGASANVAGTFSYTPALGTVLNAGASQTLSATFTPTDTVNYAPATKTVALTVNQATPVLAWTAPTAITYGTALTATQLNASTGVAGTFNYTPALGATLNAGASQTLSVTFTPTDTVNYTTATKTVSLTVNQATPALTWTTPAAITYGTALTATQLNASSNVGGTYSYNPASGTVLNAGSNQALAVTFTPTDTTNFTGATGSTTLTVNPATQSITFSPIGAVALETPVSLVATASSGLAVSFSIVSGNASLNGAMLTVHDTGDVTVRAAQAGNANYLAASVFDQTVSAGKAAATVTLSALSASYDGTPKAVTVTTVPAGLTVAVTYEGSATPPTTAGSYHIIATVSDANYQGLTSGTLVIAQAVPAVTWAAPGAITYGTALTATQLNATASVPGTFVYTPAAGTVLNAGASQTLATVFTPTDAVNYTGQVGSVLLTVNPAPLTVTADNVSRVYAAANPALTLTYAGFVNNDTLASLTTATPPRLTAPTPATAADTASPVGPYAVTLTGGSAANYTLTLVPGTLTVTKATATVTLGNLAQTYDGSPKSVSSVTVPTGLAVVLTYDATATVPTAAGSHLVVATINDLNYQGSASDTLVIAQAMPVLTWAAPAAITYGTALSAAQLNATASVPGSFSYSPALGTVLNAGANQTLTVTFTPTDAVNYTTAMKTVALTVNQAAPVLTWTAPAAITYGTALSATQLNATASVPGAFVYTPAAGNVPAVGASQPLSATFTPTDTVNYTTATTSTTLTVNKASPTVTWTAPAAITYGTALSATQLKATASIPGTFSYTPAAGTILGAGVGQTLSVTFTPTDSANQSATTVTVSLTVNPALLTVTAANKARVYGADNPALTFTYSGFVNGDTKAALTTEPVATTPATTASAPGTYAITLTGGSAANYTFTLVAATLTVTPKNYAGTYFGTFASGGTWALTVKDDGTATYIAYLADRHTAIIVQLAVDSTGAFSVTGSEQGALDTDEIRRSADTRSALAVGAFTLSGNINLGGVTGQLTGLGETFTGAADLTTGPAAAYAGYYTATGLSTASGAAYSIVSPGGMAVTIVVAPGLVDGAQGAVNAAGQFTATTTAGTSLALQLDATAQSVAITATPAGQTAPISFAGIASGAVPTSRLVNLSVRAQVGVGDNTLIVGYVVGGSGAKPLLIRAVGPSLSNFGLTGTLIDPKISVSTGGAFPLTIGSNDDWDDTRTSLIPGVSAQVGAFALNPGSLDAALLLPTQSVPGSYAAFVTDRTGTTGLALAEVYDTDTGTGTARLLNLSARARVGTGNNLMIAGFVVVGNAPVKVLLRGVGPTLATQSVPTALTDPRIDLYQAGGGTNTLIASNDNWGGGAALTAAFTATGAFALPAASKDAALLVTLPAGVYSVTLSGVNSTTGVALVEIYEVP